jgi:signal transduction histidine kinase
MRSLRVRLLAALLGVVLLVSTGWLLCIAWFTLRANTSQADSVLRTSADTILFYLPGQMERPRAEASEAAGDSKLPLLTGNLIASQVWLDRRIVSRTPDAPVTPMKTSFADGFSNVRVGRQHLRVYAASSADGRLQVQVARSLAEWEDDIWRAVEFGLANIAGLLLLLGGAVWCVSHWSFRSVAAVDEALQQRRALDFSALPIKDLPDEIRPLVVSFNHLLDRLHRAVESERRFISDAAHELRTPLAVLSAQAHVALHAIRIDEKDDALRQLAAGVNRCSRLAGQLLELARLDAAAGIESYAGLELAKLVEIVVRDFEGPARQKNQQLTVCAEPCTIRGNLDEVGILLRNLVDNAVRFTRPGGRIAVTCERVVVDGVACAILSVSDDGPGVPQCERANIFERFYRVAGTGQSGSGIGLSLVMRIAQLHEAQIKVSDGLNGRGLCVAVHFALM